MIRYALAAIALKTFSLNEASRRLYRQLGNTYGAKRRKSAADLETRIAQGDLLLELARKYDAFHEGDRVLELGTGWLHWYSLYASLFHRLRFIGLDIWDNRQLDALIATARKLRTALEKTHTHGESSALARLDRIIESRSFEELYARIGFEYVIEPNGSLDGFADHVFGSIFSMHVLEHVPRESVDALIANMYRTMKPGAYTIHQIGIDDHLAHYDKKASSKQYLKYSDRTWRWLFENDIQYMNRLQPSEWLARFEAAGFQCVERIAKARVMEGLRVHPQFKHLPPDDYGCTILTIVHRKPPLQ